MWSVRYFYAKLPLHNDVFTYALRVDQNKAMRKTTNLMIHQRRSVFKAILSRQYRKYNNTIRNHVFKYPCKFRAVFSKTTVIVAIEYHQFIRYHVKYVKTGRHCITLMLNPYKQTRPFFALTLQVQPILIYTKLTHDWLVFYFEQQPV